MVPLPDWGAGSGGRVSAFDPAHERIGRADARRGDGWGGCNAPLHRRRKPLNGDYSFSRHGRRRVGKTPANDESFCRTAMKKRVLATETAREEFMMLSN